MSRMYAAIGKPDKCREWLSKCQQENYLQRATRWQLSYFENVYNMEWFQQMILSPAKDKNKE